ncbi:MAG: helix-turn-helix domain-containing protein [Methyloprofundus sp.]|nr:helix-turn-helix domain-containing protein [Methyloprofundus sp.]
MAQTKQLIHALKRTLKAQGLSYDDVAKELDLSEASVKRLFSHSSFSLARLDKVCQMMGMEISDLVTQMQRYSHAMVSELSLQQEQEIASDTGLLLVTVCILNRWTLAQLIEHYHLSEHQCIHYLAVLDRLQLIDLLANNRIKLRVAANFKWIDNGPIQQFFQQKLASDFFSTTFNQQHEQLIVINGMLSAEAMAVFHRKLTQLAREFDALNQNDASLSLSQRSGTTVVLAMRNWRLGLFDSLRK